MQRMSPLLALSGHPSAPHMSAFGGKADMLPHRKMSAYDPKWTLEALERGDDIIFKQTPIVDRFGFRFHHSTLFRRTD